MNFKLLVKVITGLWMMHAMAFVHAGSPVWTLTPLTATKITVAVNATATVSYRITNNSKKSHILTMNAIPGVMQTTTPGNCSNPFVLGYRQSCVLNLTIDGSAISGNTLGGPVVCEQSNPNQCYQPSLANSLEITKGPVIDGMTTLSTSVSNLALSITGLTEFGVNGTPLSGVARIITITNTGSYPATNLSVTPPTWPSGTTNSTTCSTTLPAGNSCTITITPGNTPTSDGTNPCSATAAVPGIIQVSAGNATTVSTSVVVLSYGCIYQSGYIYAFDDTTPNTGSVGGKVATLSNQANNTAIWSSNGNGGGAGDVANDIIYGVSETSTTSSPNPNTGQIAGQTACNGALDGLCNTNNIYLFYPTVNLSYYSTGLCKQTIDQYSDWYLPAICEAGYDTTAQNTGCGTINLPTLQNMQSSLIDFNNINVLTMPAHYATSTEYSGNPSNVVWWQYFDNAGDQQQGGDFKSKERYVRCSRILTL